MEEIIKELINYSLNGKDIDLEYFKYVVSLIRDKKQLNDYIKDIVFELDKPNKELMNYNSRKKIISVFKNSIDKQNDYIYSKYKIDNKKDIYLLTNLFILASILHEIEHANQKKKIDYNNDFESDILLICNPFKYFTNSSLSVDEYNNEIYKYFSRIDLIKYQYFLSFYYSESPNERLADLYSYKEVIDSLDKYKSEIPELVKQIITSNYEDIMFNNYENKESNIMYSPTQDYFDTLKSLNIDFINNIIDDKTIGLISNPTLDTDTCLLYGLPIKKDEYKAKVLKKTNVSQYIMLYND